MTATLDTLSAYTNEQAAWELVPLLMSDYTSDKDKERIDALLVVLLKDENMPRDQEEELMSPFTMARMCDSKHLSRVWC